MDTSKDTDISVTGSGGMIALIDAGRAKRCGIPEAIFAAGKTPTDTLAIAEAMVKSQGFSLVTKAGSETMAVLRQRWPEAKYSARGGSALIGKAPEQKNSAQVVAIVAAGTSDLGVAEEAALTLDALGRKHHIIADVGVAGIHRLFNRLEDLRQAAIVVAVAGMEGALPSVISGLISAPVIAVPTSVGYGASFAGFAALLGMLNTCSPGIAVVNIDNGFGAAVMASRILDVGFTAK